MALARPIVTRFQSRIVEAARCYPDGDPVAAGVLPVPAMYAGERCRKASVSAVGLALVVRRLAFCGVIRLAVKVMDHGRACRPQKHHPRARYEMILVFDI